MRMDGKVRMGVIGIVVAGTLVLSSLQYDRLPFFSSGIHYSADFSDAGGLLPGDNVEVAGVRDGRVDSVTLAGDHVRVRFTLSPDIVLGTSTSAAIKTTTLLGRKALAVTPSRGGVHRPGETIPLDRTTSPYSLNDALGDLSNTVRDLDTDQLNKALETMSDALSGTPAPLRSALDGVSRLSRSINERDKSLRELLAKAQSVTKVLADRGAQINALVVDGNQLLGELDLRRTAISELIVNVGAVSRQLTGLVQDNQAKLRPTLNQLNSVLDLLQRNKDNVQKAIDGLVGYSGALSEQVGNGPYFNAYVQNATSVGVQALVDVLVRPDHLPADLQEYLKTFALTPTGPAPQVGNGGRR